MGFRKNILIFFFITISFFVFNNCSTLLNRYDSDERYKITKSYKGAESFFLIKKDKNGKIFGELSSPLLFKTVLKGEVEFKEKDYIEFNISSIYFFANWPNGWTEGELQASGFILFKNNDNYLKVEILEKIEMLEVISGKIRYFDRYFIDDEGLINVKNRIYRIMELVSFLKKQNGLPSIFGAVASKTLYGQSMKDILLPYLFPEVLIKKPDSYYNTINNDGGNYDKRDRWVIGSDILWNKIYTKKILPENLHSIRDSGTMWRDYEEAAGLIMAFYNFDHYLYNILQKSKFKKMK